jgi:UDP-N-acetylglucosamine--N-acetylmuramyl-(pentapeptide) pyrophosphoryl-undecaprenol N-acetylglucosamine transferase
LPDTSLKPSGSPRGVKLCLAASGGGHVRQLLDLEPVWSRHDHFFVTEQTALGESIAKNHRTHYLPHFALGQAKLGAPLRMLGSAIKSLFASIAIMVRERPDVVISTGAGAVIFPVLLGRLIGAHVVVVESFARFDHPSLFFRMTAPIAHDLVIQSKNLASAYPRAHVFDPFKILDGTPPPKSQLLFATVGAILSFDRLSNTVAKLKAAGDIPEDVLLQTGAGGVRPSGVEVRETLDFDEIQSVLERASIVVCHGGTGSIITALRQGCHVVAMPRLAKFGEVYDDHQSEITDAFAARGLIQVAETEDDLRVALALLPHRKRMRATTDPKDLIAFLDKRLAELRPRRSTSVGR